MTEKRGNRLKYSLKCICDIGDTKHSVQWMDGCVQEDFHKKWCEWDRKNVY